MRLLLSLVKQLTGVVFATGATLLALLAVGAGLGFVHPLADFFNHLQPFMLAGTLASVLLAPVFVRTPRLRSYTAAIGATGLLACVLIVVPEAAARLVSRTPLPTDSRPIHKLMTHNLFGLNYDMKRVADAIAKEDPDIITFQEYFEEQRGQLHPLISDSYPHFAICAGGKRGNIAIYAKSPFEADAEGNCTRVDDDSDLRTARISARFEGEAGAHFTVMTTHLDWPLQISKLDDGETPGEGLDLATLRQRSQMADLADAVNQTDGPLILSADFNATSWSYALRGFQQATGLYRHTRSLLTFPARFYIFGWRDTLPFLPLDHVMTRGGIAVHDVRAGDPAGSDHRPVIVVFSVQNEQTLAEPGR